MGMKKLQLLDQTLMLRLILIMDTDTDITDHMDTTEDTMERDLLMNLQLLAQILKLMLMLGMDIMVTDMDMDITDHTDTGDTMERDLLMKPQPLAQTLMLMLMPGMVIMVMDMVMDITDHMDTMVMDTGERSKLAALFNQMTSFFFSNAL